MKKYWVLFALLILLASCSGIPSDEAIQTAIAQTSAAQLSVAEFHKPTEELLKETEPTEQPTIKLEPTNTPEPINTKDSTNTVEQTNSQTAEVIDSLSNSIAKNYIISKEINGVEIEVCRILIAQKEGFEQDFSEWSYYDEKSTIVMFIFCITNNTSGVISFPFFLGTAAVNGEQISFEEYWREFYSWRGDNLNSDILPGSTIIGGFWSGIKRSSWNEIETIVISIPSPRGSDNKNFTEDFLFTIDATNWEFEPLPDELK